MPILDPVPTATLYDGVIVTAIPADAQWVAAYFDGRFANYPLARARFPKAGIVVITTTRNMAAAVADVESGDLTPAAGAAWAKDQVAVGRRPTLYVARDNWPTVNEALAGAGVAEGAVDFWVADWTGTAHTVAGAVATQWANPPASGGRYDISTAEVAWLERVALFEPSPAPAPDPIPTPPAPPPPSPKGLLMPWLANDGTTTWVIFPNGTRVGCSESSEATALGLRFGGPVAVSPAFIAQIPMAS